MGLRIFEFHKGSGLDVYYYHHFNTHYSTILKCSIIINNKIYKTVMLHYRIENRNGLLDRIIFPELLTNRAVSLLSYGAPDILT